MLNLTTTIRSRIHGTRRWRRRWNDQLKDCMDGILDSYSASELRRTDDNGGWKCRFLSNEEEPTHAVQLLLEQIHVSEYCWNCFQSQMSKVKVTPTPNAFFQVEASFRQCVVEAHLFFFTFFLKVFLACRQFDNKYINYTMRQNKPCTVLFAPMTLSHFFILK